MRGEIKIVLVSVQLTQKSAQLTVGANKSAQLSCTGFIRNSLATGNTWVYQAARVSVPGDRCVFVRQ